MNAPASTSDQRWLVRTTENQVTGPFTLDQVREMVRQGKLKLEDELCGANTYWFYLHESEEVRSQLGIEVPRQLYERKTDEITETQTDTTSLDQEDRPRQEPARALPEVPELEGALEDIGENTAVMSNRAFRDYRNKKAPAQQPPSRPQPVASPQVEPGLSGMAASENPLPPGRSGLPARKIAVERSKIFQLVAYLVMAGAVVVILEVIKLLQQRPG